MKKRRKNKRNEMLPLDYQTECYVESRTNWSIQNIHDNHIMRLSYI